MLEDDLSYGMVSMLLTCTPHSHKCRPVTLSRLSTSLPLLVLVLTGDCYHLLPPPTAAAGGRKPMSDAAVTHARNIRIFDMPVYIRYPVTSVAT